MIKLNMEDIENITNVLYKEIKENQFNSDVDTKQIEKTYDKMCKISNMRFNQRKDDILIPVTRKPWEKY